MRYEQVPNRRSALVTLMRGSNDKQRRQAEVIDQKIIDFLKTMPENEAAWRVLLAHTNLFDTQLDRGLKRLIQLSIVEKRLIWIRGYRLDVYHLRNPSLRRVFDEKRPEPDMKTRWATRRIGFQTIRDYGGWRHGSRSD